MIEKNKGMLILISLIIILVTEMVGINMQIAFNYLPIFFAIITTILFNLRLKEETNNKKRMIIVNIIILSINFLLTKLITGYFTYISILAILILCKFLDRIDFSQFDKLFIWNIVKYYIIPLAILLIIEMCYFKIAMAVSKLYEMWMVNYVFVAMGVIYMILTANIVMVMLAILFKDIINSKIVINVSSKSVFIIFSIILLIILCIKIILGCINGSEADSKINILNDTIQSNSLNEYYELNFEPSLKIEGEAVDKVNRYIISFNDILIKGESNGADLFYKMNANTLQELVNRRTITKKEALQEYKESAESYIERLNIHKENLSMQNISNVIIYLLDIISIFIVYKKLQ